MLLALISPQGEALSGGVALLEEVCHCGGKEKEEAVGAGCIQITELAKVNPHTRPILLL